MTHHIFLVKKKDAIQWLQNNKVKELNVIIDEFEFLRWSKNLPKLAVWNVVKFSETLLPPVILVAPFPSPMNIKFHFFLPTFKLFSS